MNESGEYPEHATATLELTIDCLRLLLSDTARFHRAMEEAVAAGTAFTDGEAHAEIGEIAPPIRPVGELNAAMAEPNPLMFRYALTLAGAAMSWAAMRADCTVAEILAEFEEELRRKQRSRNN
jgi:hypothetical protein